MSNLRVVISLDVKLKLWFHKSFVSTAFLNAGLDDETIDGKPLPGTST